MRATELAHSLVRPVLTAGVFAIDATVGNGHDLAFLAEEVGETGHVLGFDIQDAALAEAARRVGYAPQVRLIHAGHETLANHLHEIGKPLAAVMFNLGYLPGADHTIRTRTVTTIAALEQAIQHLMPGGIITVVLYTGHDGGAAEAEAVRSFAASLPKAFAASSHTRINAIGKAPELIAISRVG